MAERLTLSESAVLRLAVAAGPAGCPTPSGETGGETVARLADRGLVRWEQSSPFVATMWATPCGRAVVAAHLEGGFQ